jgi:hypothetical protein
MRHLILAVGIAVAATSFVQPASAAETAPPRAKMMFWFMDRNGDGFIDVAEIEAVRTARFQTMDTNGDGKLTKAEAIAALDSGRGHGKGHRKGDGNGPSATKASAPAERSAKRQGAMLKRLGFTNGVEVVTLAEFVANDTPMLKRADKDGDGKISEAEFLAVAGKAGHARRTD